VRAFSADPNLLQFDGIKDIVEGEIGQKDDWLIFVGDDRRSIGLLSKELLTRPLMPTLSSTTPPPSAIRSEL